MTDWREINERLELRDRKLEEAILSDVGAQRALRKLVRAGANRASVMGLLVGSVRDTGGWRKQARHLKRRLESVANEVETVASHAERVQDEYRSHALVMTMILHLFSGKWDEKDPQWDEIWEQATSAKGSSAKILFGFMRLYAKNCRAKAAHVGKILREFPPKQRRQALDTLMLAVWYGTRKHYDREIAYLLTIAFEASGEKKQFSEDQVKKHRQRYVLPRIREYLERCASRSPRIAEVEGSGTV